MRRNAMTFTPPGLFAVPMTGAVFASSAIIRILADSGPIDEHTTITLYVAVGAMLILLPAVYWFGCFVTRYTERQRIQTKLIRYLYRTLPDVDDRHGKAADLLAELDRGNDASDDEDGKGIC